MPITFLQLAHSDVEVHDNDSDDEEDDNDDGNDDNNND